MNSVRTAISTLFQSPIGEMNFVSYFSYVNTAGKITARSLMDVVTVLCAAVEEQEKKNEQYEANFKEIEQILQKLVEAPKESVGYAGGAFTVLKEETPAVETTEAFKCETCGKEAKNKLGFLSHQRSHKPKE